MNSLPPLNRYLTLLGLLTLASLITVTHAAPLFVAGEILVKPAKGTTEAALHALLSFHGAVEVDEIR